MMKLTIYRTKTKKICKEIGKRIEFINLKTNAH